MNMKWRICINYRMRRSVMVSHHPLLPSIKLNSFTANKSHQIGWTLKTDTTQQRYFLAISCLAYIQFRPQTPSLPPTSNAVFAWAQDVCVQPWHRGQQRVFYSLRNAAGLWNTGLNFTSPHFPFLLFPAHIAHPRAPRLRAESHLMSQRHTRTFKHTRKHADGKRQSGTSAWISSDRYTADSSTDSRRFFFFLLPFFFEQSNEHTWPHRNRQRTAYQ